MIKEISEEYFLFSLIRVSVDPPPPLTCHNPMYACSINCGVKCKIYHHENKLYKMAGGCDEKISEKYKYTHVKYTHVPKCTFTSIATELARISHFCRITSSHVHGRGWGGF